MAVLWLNRMWCYECAGGADCVLLSALLLFHMCLYFTTQNDELSHVRRHNQQNQFHRCASRCVQNACIVHTTRTKHRTQSIHRARVGVASQTTEYMYDTHAYINECSGGRRGKVMEPGVCRERYTSGVHSTGTPSSRSASSSTCIAHTAKHTERERDIRIQTYTHFKTEEQ